MKYNFDKNIDRSDNYSAKWSEMEDRFGSNDLLPMWIADMDFYAPDFILNSLNERLDQGVFGYVSDPDSYVYSILNWLDNRYSWKVRPSDILFSPKVVTSISLIINSLTNVNDKIMILQPVYPPFASVVTNNNRQLVVSSLIKDENNYYTIDFNDIENKISDVKLFILCNPHNPVGRVWKKDELTKLGEICLQNNVRIISDEIHSDIIMKNNKHIPIASINDEFANNTITCMAPTKTFNLAGLSTSFMIIHNEDDYSKINDSLDNLHLRRTNAFSLVATNSAYTYGEDWLSELLIYLEDNIDYCIDFINEYIPSINVCKPEGTYLLWLDFSNLDLDDDSIQKHLLEIGKVALNEGYTFGIGGNGFFRMNIACPRYMVIDGLNRIKLTVDAILKN